MNTLNNVNILDTNHRTLILQHYIHYYGNYNYKRDSNLKKNPKPFNPFKTITCYKSKQSNILNWNSIVDSSHNFSTSYNLAILTGERSNVTVLDIDVKDNGINYFTSLYNFYQSSNLNIREILKTFPLYQTTPSGGYHIFFNYYSIPSRIKITINNKPAGIDLINDNKYLLIEPSELIVDNTTKRCSQYKLNIPIEDINTVILPNFPQWLINIFMAKAVSYDDLDESFNLEYPDNSEEYIYPDNSSIKRRTTDNTSEDYIIECLEMLTTFYWDTYETWRNLIFSIGRIFINKDKSYEIGILHSKKSEKYNKNMVVNLINTARKSPNMGYGLKQIENYCREVNTELHDEICQKYNVKKHTNVSKIVRFTSLYSISEFKNKFLSKVFESKIEMYNSIMPYLSNCVVYMDKPQEFIYNLYENEYCFSKTLPLYWLDYKVDKNIKTISLDQFVRKNVNYISNFSDIVCNPNYTGNDKFNIITPIKAIPIEGNCKTIIDFIKDVICSNNELLFDYVMQWVKNLCIYMRNITTLTLYSPKQGTGKNTFTDFLMEFIIGRNLSYTESSLMETLNTHTDLGGIVLVIVNEISTTKDEYKHHMDKLKDLITGFTVSVNKKFIQKYQVDNITNWILTTNNVDCLQLSDDDRRHTCIRVSDKYIQNIEYFSNVRKSFNQETGNAFLYYLLNTKFSSCTLTPFETECKKEMVHVTLIEQFIIDVKNRDYLIQNFPFDDDNQKEITIQSSKLYDNFLMYQKKVCSRPTYISHTKFGKELSKLSCVKKDKASVNYYTISF